MNTLDSIDSGSNYNFNDKMERANTPRSLFDLSHLVTTTLENAGYLMPVTLIETIPGDSFELSIDSLLRVLPLAVPLYSRQRLYVHAFYSRYSDLWAKAQTFMTKGYSGNTILTIPTLNDENLESSFAVVQAGDVFDMLGIPIGTTRAQIIAAKINALPFMMYERIWRDYFMNKNFYIGNLLYLPDDDHDFMLSNTGEIISNPSNLAIGPQLGKKHYRDYPQDYFLSALPFPQRGDTPTLNFNLSASNMPLGFYDVNQFIPLFTKMAKSDTNDYSNLIETRTQSSLQSSSIIPHDGYTHTVHGLTSENVMNQVFQSNLGKKALVVNANEVLAYSSITLNTLRELSAQQSILEKMARTDGSYAQFGQTFFGRSSKNALDYKPIYIGGNYQSIAFTEVLQTTPTATSPLGSYAGHGISYDNGYLGKVDCDDYGYIMLIASVMPDVYYSQGLDRTLTKQNQSDMYLPERARLGLRPILNKEIYFSGNLTQDNDLFAYQNPYDELRYKPSTIHGKIADPTALSFYPYTQARKFTALPTYSQSFASAQSVRKDYLAAPTEVAYTAQFNIKCRAVRPIPYNPEPARIF